MRSLGLCERQQRARLNELPVGAGRASQLQHKIEVVLSKTSQKRSKRAIRGPPPVSTTMALLQAIKQGVLASLRVPVAHQAAAPTSLFLLRGFAADASYLDKKDVTDRVLNTVKGFEKVDAGAVSV